MINHKELGKKLQTKMCVEEELKYSWELQSMKVNDLILKAIFYSLLKGIRAQQKFNLCLAELDTRGIL